MEEKVTVSIIIPIYKGKKYIRQLINNIDENYKYMVSHGKNNVEMEIIFVNDYPKDILEYDAINCKNIRLVIINNNTNSGIHQSRINGLCKAKGEFVLFLDQDDYIESSFFYSQMEKIGNADMIIANGIDEFLEGEKIWFRTKKKQNMCKNKFYYLNHGNMIRSPGQCLIRKKSIPDDWKKYVLKNNGADDIMLWLMMLEEKKIFEINEEILYKHKYSGKNYSLDYKKMRKSEKEMVEVSKKSKILKKRTAKSYFRISYLRNTLLQGTVIEKIGAVILNIDKVLSIAFIRSFE